MRLFFIVLVVLTLSIQYPLWWGKGGWLHVQELQQRALEQQEINQALQARNNALQAEVQDLSSGTDAVQERARGELGLVRDGEIFVEFIGPPAPVRQAPGESAGKAAVGINDPRR
ncbi:MAG: cell division protein FtsB [Burkholderiaceae bacterium]|jgi:cell division protein FtsB